MARSLQQSSQDALPPRRPTLSNAARVPLWRKCLLLVALVCAIGLYSDAVTHHHQTLAQEMGCPICHVVSHNALTSFTPSIALPVRIFSWFRSRLPNAGTDGFRQFFNPAYRSRAPPLSAPKFV
ncbi:MAG TPA: hypothetical protein VFK24_06730 [Gammaproteobacteria bacterium]|nr:hypothetical protein [Gammaproteobacteria bacterium]